MGLLEDESEDIRDHFFLTDSGTSLRSPASFDLRDQVAGRSRGGMAVSRATSVPASGTWSPAAPARVPWSAPQAACGSIGGLRTDTPLCRRPSPLLGDAGHNDHAAPVRGVRAEPTLLRPLPLLGDAGHDVALRASRAPAGLAAGTSSSSTSRLRDGGCQPKPEEWRCNASPLRGCANANRAGGVDNHATAIPVVRARPCVGKVTDSTADLCCFCFRVLLAHLRGRPAPAFPTSADPFFKAPLFVTWLKRRRGDRELGEPELRGCIGCLDPIVIVPGLSEYVLRSSLQDRRFPPVLLEEVPALTCRLSILCDFETCKHAYDWQVGVHGILINFTDAHQRNYTATYLPEVARDHGMTQASAIRELVTKAGYTGPCDQYLISRINATRYKTMVETATYKEFLLASEEDSLAGA